MCRVMGKWERGDEVRTMEGKKGCVVKERGTVRVTMLHSSTVPKRCGGWRVVEGKWIRWIEQKGQTKPSTYSFQFPSIPCSFSLLYACIPPLSTGPSPPQSRRRCTHDEDKESDEEGKGTVKRRGKGNGGGGGGR